MARRAAEPRLGSSPGAPQPAPAYYASGHGRWRDIRALLHPPYTAWHLSYVVIGAVSGPLFSWEVLGATLLAFFLAVGVAAHALDELHGRPLCTSFPSSRLVAAASISLAGAMALGVAGAVTRIGPGLVVFIAVGAVLVVGYSLELLGGRLHGDVGFALAWGAFPVLAAAYAENRALPAGALVLAAAAALLSASQRALSAPARTLRRQVLSVEGRIVSADGTSKVLDRDYILGPLETALRRVSWAMVLVAAGLVTARTLHWRW